MRKIIRKYQKKLLAFFGVLLMVMFIKGLVPQGQRPEMSPRQVGTLNGEKVMQYQLSSANSEWQMLKSLRFVNPNQPDAEPEALIVRIFGPVLADQINRSNQSNPLFFLLVQEARQHGIVINTEQLQNFVNNNVAPLPEEGTEERELVEGAVSDMLSVRELLDRADSAVKIPKPYQSLLVAQNLQMMSIKFVPITIERFMSQLPAPTDADIQNQFDSYSDREPALVGAIPSQFGQKNDPLGFGYKIPNRVQVQYIGLSHADLRAAAVSSKSLQDWYVAAYGEFMANRDAYDERPVAVASTRPTVGPTTQTDVKKLDNAQDDFALHAQLVLDDLYDRQTIELGQTILKQIMEKLNSGFGTYRDAQASKDPSATAAIARFTSIKFLNDLAASIQSQYNVTPIVGDIAQPKTMLQLQQIEGIGNTAYQGQIPFGQYAVEYFQPWMPDNLKASERGALALTAWQPSNPLEDQTENVYIFRISGSDPAHTPPLSEVKAQVIADWKQATAYNKALDEGYALLSRAQQRGLDGAAMASDLPSPITTDMFNPELVRNPDPRYGEPLVPPLVLKPDSARELASVAQQLTSAQGGNGRPQLLAQLYADSIVAVIELNQTRAIVQPEEVYYVTNRIMIEASQEMRFPLEADLCKYENVAARMNYQPQPKSGS